jgi:c-di-GMP-binding flagellar brake protein YcgR
MKSRDELLEDAYKKFRKASVDACDQAAIEARNAKVLISGLKNLELTKSGLRFICSS